MKGKILGVFVTIILGGILFFVGIDNRVAGTPIEAFQVYLDGNKLGLISSKEELLNLIDTEQEDIKKKYNVDKVYPPDGLDIEPVYTYNENITDVNSIYNKIKDIEPFTIEGYTVTIKYTEDKVLNDGEIIKPGAPLKLYLLNKEDMETALYNTAAAFIGTMDLKNYEEGTQKEITDTGYTINSIYFEETITVKKDYISTEKQIFTNEDDLSRYLLFGTLKEQKSYYTHEGENLELIADANNLNIEELLIANPQYPSANVLLSAGEKINVGLIAPLVSVVYYKTVVEDIQLKFKTETIKDNSKYSSYKVVKTKGQPGVMRVTQTIKYINGEIRDFDFDKKEQLKPVVNEVVVRGTKVYGGGYQFIDEYEGNGEWSWPTAIPASITSRFKWRWGRQHKGIDISGPGPGSPIYASRGGYVYKVNYNRYKAEGLSIYIDHGNGYVTQYMHLSKILVKEGQTVRREQMIGKMGSTGVSTGTHLHFGVWKGKPYQGGTVLDPCKSALTC